MCIWLLPLVISMQRVEIGTTITRQPLTVQNFMSQPLNMVFHN